MEILSVAYPNVIIESHGESNFHHFALTLSEYL